MSALPREGAIARGAYLYPVRVYYEDTDAIGLVYYANYLRFAERARSEMLRRVGIEQERLRAETGAVFVVRRCTIDFLRPARLDDDLVVTTRLVATGGASLHLDQEVTRDEATLARLASQIACLGPNGRPHRLPPAVRDALAGLTHPPTPMVSAHAR